MGKGTDKLYITHSEWSSSDAYSASAGAKRGTNGVPFRKLPYNFCAASLQPFNNPVCTPDGTIFDVEVIGAWLEKHPNQNPVTGEPLAKKDLIKLNFSRNSESVSGDPLVTHDLIDPVTYKVFTDNTHIVAIRHGTYANVFSYDTVERMNIKAKMWLDLIDDEPFTRADIITLQDPQNAASRNLDDFKFLKDGEGAQTAGGEDKGRDINAAALGSMGDKVLKAKLAVEKARKAREAGGDVNRSTAQAKQIVQKQTAAAQPALREKKLAANAAAYTTGKAAASFTSTGLTPETSGERALLTDEEFMLKPRRIQHKGYARMETSLGDITLELHTDSAPKAVWNFVKLAQKGYYRGVAFHRNIPGFMIQGGDPSGTGKGGQSIWGKNFDDEFEGGQSHSARGVLSMANKGKNTNSSQFFLTYKPTHHLDNKHTVFGRISSGLDVLSKMEDVETDGSNRPLRKILIKDVVVFVDPFAEFQAEKQKAEDAERQREEIVRQGGTEADRTTWTGKRIRGDGRIEDAGTAETVGKYLKMADTKAKVDEWEEAEQPIKKKMRGTGGFGNFDGW